MLTGNTDYVGLSFTDSDFRNGIISCPEKAILKLKSAAKVHCILAMNSSQIETNLTKTQGNCGPDTTSNYKLAIFKSKNDTKILTISFGNVSWATGGQYMLKVNMGNITEKQMIEIKVAGKRVCMKLCLDHRSRNKSYLCSLNCILCSFLEGVMAQFILP